MRLRFSICLFLILCPFVQIVAAPSISLATYAEGYVELYPDDKDRWHLNQGTGWNPKTFFELKLDVALNKQFQFWFKSSATTDSDDRNSPLIFSFYDMHLKYKNTLGDGGVELIAFMREDSYFWMDQPLLRFTDNSSSWGVGDDKGDKGEMNGIYFNLWNMMGLNLIKGVIVARGMTDDPPSKTYENESINAALRLRKDLFGGKLKLGATGVYYKMRGKPHYWAGALDVSASIKTFQLIFEGGTFNTPATNIWADGTADHPRQFTYKGELRGSFSLGSFGQAGFLASSYYASTNFQNWRGNGTDGATQNRMQENFEVWYNFPLKAIYLKNSTVYYHPLYWSDGDNWNEFSSGSSHIWNYDYTGIASTGFENYTELYIEFKYGFKFKSYFKHSEGGEYHVDGFKGKWNTLFFQLEVENSFAKIKPQVLLLNFDDDMNSASAFGGEVLINVTDTIKFYSRFAMVNGSQSTLYRSDEKKRSWATFFCELQFLKFFSNTDIYLTFGNGDHTNDDIVHDKNGGILNGRKLEKKIGFSIKYWL